MLDHVDDADRVDSVRGQVVDVEVVWLSEANHWYECSVFLFFVFKIIIWLIDSPFITKLRAYVVFGL